MAEGKLILITGASVGIGRAAARMFVERGDRVIGTARTEERLKPVAEELGEGFFPVAADVADAGQMTALAERVLREHGVPDVIVANAGVGLDALFAETTDEHLKHVLEINVVGVFRTVRPFVKAMVERGSGRILLISSVVGKRGIPHYSGYAASKFALHGVAESLRVELHGSGVSVGLVCPSSTETEFHSRKLSEGPRQSETRVAKHSAESVARAIVRMADSRRREVVLSAEGKFMTLVNGLAPGLVDRLLARVMMKRG